MGNLRACRTCLAMSGRMIDIGAHFQLYLKEVLGHKILYSSEVPPYLCHECAALLMKSYKFKMKCLSSQTALFDILQDQNEITEKDLNSINRQNLQLESNLTYYSEPPSNTFIFKHQDEDVNEEVKVKQEPNDIEGEITEDLLRVVPFPEVKDEDSDDASNGGGDICLGSQSEDSDYNSSRNPKEKTATKIAKGYKCELCYVGFEDEDAFEEHMERHKKAKGVNQHKESMVVRKPLSKMAKRKLKGELMHLIAYKKSRVPHKDYDVEKIMKDNELEDDFIAVQLTREQQVAELRLKKKKANYRESPYKCELCFIGYLQEDTFKNHMARHEVTFGEYECDVCQISIKHQHAYVAHVMKHALRFHCRRCAYVGGDLDQAKKHKVWHEGVTLKCQHCDEVSASLRGHVRHVRAQHAAVGLCAACGYSFGSRAGLRAHRLRVHPRLDPDKSDAESDGAEETESKPRCVQCEIDFDTLVDKKMHLLTSERHAPRADVDITARCTSCGHVSADVPALRVHRRVHALAAAARRLHALRRRAGPARHARLRDLDDGDEAYPAKCEHCEETMKSRAAHFHHYKTNHKDQVFPIAGENFICDQCGRGFPTIALLAYHIRSHDQQPTLKCPDCRKPFFGKEKLATHRLSHSRGTRACGICAKTFKTQLGLDQHVANHSRAGAHPCLQCAATFTRAAGLALHVKKSHRVHAPPSAVE